MAWTIQNGGPDDRELRAVVRKVVDATEPDMVILFGSAARRQMHKGSDVDLLVVKEVDDVRKLKSSARRALLKEDSVSRRAGGQPPIMGAMSLAAQIIDQRVSGIVEEQSETFDNELRLGTDEHRRRSIAFLFLVAKAMAFDLTGRSRAAFRRSTASSTEGTIFGIDALYFDNLLRTARSRSSFSRSP